MKWIQGNHEISKKKFDLGVWGPETIFGPPGPRRRIKPYAQNSSCTFDKQHFIFSRIMKWIQENHEISKKKFDLGVWGPETTFAPLGPRRSIKPYVQNPGCNFHKQDLIFSRIMKWIQQIHEISKNSLTLEPGAQKLHLGHLGKLCKSRTIAVTLTSKTLCTPW